ncbi:heavy metal response regulator transcription factor [Xylophilus sp. GOD-11R]|uniref:heavy metal response regulator transcription factor n=1 Tax=Xylophilus sp. GOD-11R TaxID=3089814 RepID=UPI00298BEB38|nr:heavy metal response regulator transcription factor [Xylophilus sp. GOD-11R]WPB55374.1 heavy metal response regulator transcription factor [Xylophilus sp. GOD-11R]
MRILVIEDEPKLADYLLRGLRENGYSADSARDGVDGLHMAHYGQYDLVLLDVMLPGLDGYGVLRGLRQEAATRSLPVLMLTARDRVEDRVLGLQAGADDYLGKPFAFSELLARLHALLRRGAARSIEDSSVLRLADLELDLLRRRASRGSVRLDLTAKEFSLLTLLLRRQGEVLSRTVLAEQVWDMNFDSDTNVVEVAVRRLRGKLDEPFARRLLHTVRGMGYVLEDRQTHEPPPSPEPLKAAASTE